MTKEKNLAATFFRAASYGVGAITAFFSLAHGAGMAVPTLSHVPVVMTASVLMPVLGAALAGACTAEAYREDHPGASKEEARHSMKKAGGIVLAVAIACGAAGYAVVNEIIQSHPRQSVPQTQLPVSPP